MRVADSDAETKATLLAHARLLGGDPLGGWICVSGGHHFDFDDLLVAADLDPTCPECESSGWEVVGPRCPSV